MSDGVHLNDLGNDLFLNNLQGGLEFLFHDQFIPTFLCNIDEIRCWSVDWWLPHRWDDYKPARFVRSHVAFAHTNSTDSMESVVLTVNMKL